MCVGGGGGGGRRRQDKLLMAHRTAVFLSVFPQVAQVARRDACVTALSC